ncbi:MAG: YeeE/YedE thiosulfate transporter family protein [Candidatus Calescibacterium sp.]|nr:YeeE/YedE family protein [Candidatus Calescibacterium sp.]MCX7971994.1 YeeE/YedE family protein [bacterium]MDW8195482.1 YeeE/YedE thiosulfate transporter family protein [Candidatus Calescibacterium sp.]
MEVLLGLVFGIIFGSILTLAKVIRYEKQVSAVLFKDMTIIKFMFSAVLVGSIGITVLYQMGLIELNLKPLALGGIIIGGILFGLGWSLTGYCPGTSLAALAEGRIHAIFAVMGMIFGSLIFANFYSYLKPLINFGNMGKLTIYQALNVSPFVIILILAIFALGLFYFFEKKRI